MASHRDPRVPGLTFRRAVLKEEDLPVDGYALLSILFGFLGFASKNKWSGWGAVFMFLASITNMRFAEADFKQLLMSGMLGLFAMAGGYAQKQVQTAES